MSLAAKNLLKEYLPIVERSISDHLSRIPKDCKIGVGMSGGVDSSVTMLLLKELGLNVFGVFMRNWIETDESGTCLAEYDYRDVEKVCEQLSVPYYSVDLSKDYHDRVFKTFLKEIEMGLTPNPDVLCNREIKFDAFWSVLEKMGANFIATGHYAQSGFKDQKFYLKKAIDDSKDQTYFLAQMPSTMLAKSLFPLGALLKKDIRKIAQAFNLATSEKKDSTGICFIGERDFKEFVARYVKASKGDFVDVHSGKILGKHDGACFYTIGQRKGLNIGGPEGPWFVVAKENSTNKVLLSNIENDPVLYSKSCFASGANWFTEVESNKWVSCTSKIRYRQKDAKAKFMLKDGIVETCFEQPQRAVTRGQYVVLYQDDFCLGSAQILD